MSHYQSCFENIEKAIEHTYRATEEAGHGGYRAATDLLIVALTALQRAKSHLEDTPTPPPSPEERYTDISPMPDPPRLFRAPSGFSKKKNQRRDDE